MKRLVAACALGAFLAAPFYALNVTWYVGQAKWAAGDAAHALQASGLADTLIQWFQVLTRATGGFVAVLVGFVLVGFLVRRSKPVAEHSSEMTVCILGGLAGAMILFLLHFVGSNHGKFVLSSSGFGAGVRRH
ncbi:hypothetical protein ACFL0Q_06830, partial [Thermodesulfobacteriota bacterium]